MKRIALFFLSKTCSRETTYSQNPRSFTLGRIKERPRSVLSASEAHQGIVETGNEHARILLEVEWNDKMRIYFTASARQENIEMKLTVPLNKCACTAAIATEDSALLERCFHPRCPFADARITPYFVTSPGRSAHDAVRALTRQRSLAIFESG